MRGFEKMFGVQFFVLGTCILMAPQPAHAEQQQVQWLQKISSMSADALFFIKGNTPATGSRILAHNLIISGAIGSSGNELVKITSIAGIKSEALGLSPKGKHPQFTLFKIHSQSKPKVDTSIGSRTKPRTATNSSDGSALPHIKNESSIVIGSQIAVPHFDKQGQFIITTGHIAQTSTGQFVIQCPLAAAAAGAPVLNRNAQVMGYVGSDLNLNAQNVLHTVLTINSLYKNYSELEPLCSCLIIDAPERVSVFVNGQKVGQGPKIFYETSPGALEVLAVIKGQMIKKWVHYPTQKSVTF